MQSASMTCRGCLPGSASRLWQSSNTTCALSTASSTCAGVAPGRHVAAHAKGDLELDAGRLRAPPTPTCRRRRHGPTAGSARRSRGPEARPSPSSRSRARQVPPPPCPGSQIPPRSPPAGRGPQAPPGHPACARPRDDLQWWPGDPWTWCCSPRSLSAGHGGASVPEAAWYTRDLPRTSAGPHRRSGPQAQRQPSLLGSTGMLSVKRVSSSPDETFRSPPCARAISAAI